MSSDEIALMKSLMAQNEKIIAMISGASAPAKGRSRTKPEANLGTPKSLEATETPKRSKPEKYRKKDCKSRRQRWANFIGYEITNRKNQGQKDAEILAWVRENIAGSEKYYGAEFTKALAGLVAEKDSFKALKAK